jgi:hypothetical protein
MTINMIGFSKRQAKEFLRKILVLQIQEDLLLKFKEKTINKNLEIKNSLKKEKKIEQISELK